MGLNAGLPNLHIALKPSVNLSYCCLFSDFGRYTLDVIANTAFGLDTNSIENPDCVFLRKLRELFSFTETASIWQKLGIVIYCKLEFPQNYCCSNDLDLPLKVFGLTLNFFPFSYRPILNRCTQVLQGRFSDP